ncbi:hypothetical protein EJ08DRAFT_722187 [Tothia fuscella]|uniref:MYND-type domain-containing protein n=1 Tax=Tothia fuscella TaxID=1048955 RepID=A0A9P4U3F0_9PEZI|nr:hypothetical protein EJ08DRAFT_722187 [Tothia fuscella]
MHFTKEDVNELCYGSAKLGRVVWSSVCFLGRLRTAYKVIVRAAERLDLGGNLTIHCLPAPISTQKTERQRCKIESPNGWTLRQAFAELGQPFDGQTLATLLGRKKTIARSETEFKQLQSRAAGIHAEIQLLLHLATLEPSGSCTFQYMGCSKHSCLLCWKFMVAYGDFRTRGCHGKVYSLWTVPANAELGQQPTQRIVKALKQVLKELQGTILSATLKSVPLEKESSLGKGSLDTIRGKAKDLAIQKLARNYLASERDHQSISRLRHQQGLTPQFTVIVMRSNQMIPTIILVEEECDVCYRRNPCRCSLCGSDWFCSTYCEARRGSLHRFKCAFSSITASDYLYLDTVEDILPTEAETLNDFGFSRCSSSLERSNLLGLYQGLRILEISSETVNEWRKKGTLVANIITSFEQNLRPGECGDYYPWFLKNQHLLLDDGDAPLRGKALLDKMIDEARPVLSIEDQVKEIGDLQPWAKCLSFLFFAMCLSQMHSPPVSRFDWWYSFGFCVCSDSYEEGRLGALYGRLVGGNKAQENRAKLFGETIHDPPRRPCTFEELWKAWEAGTLIELMDKYHLKEDRQRFKHLDTFLRTPGENWRPSVWRLRQILAVDDDIDAQALPAQAKQAMEDYGLSMCNAKEKILLRNFYQALLDLVNPLNLQRARSSRQLLKFCQLNNLHQEPEVTQILRRLDGVAE